MCLASLRCSVDVMNGGRDAMFGQSVPSPSDTLQDMEYRMKQGKYNVALPPMVTQIESPLR